MSRLRELRLHGFKTFADPTRFVFEPGVNAVIGPNGSGKSNMADAVRWVLGEQSNRSLRTRRLRLDLLSRLPHVVRGDLSLVGPAPLTPGDPRAACPGARQWRQELRPGLTGLAQVRSGSAMPWDDPALLDQHYAEHHGVVLYLAVLAEAVRNPLRAALRKARPGGGTDPVQPRHT